MDALTLPPELTIYTVGETLPRWLTWLGPGAAQDGPAPVDGAAVTEIDGAGLQMLVSLQRTLAARGCTLALQAPSPALRAACQAAGLAALVHDEAQEGA